MNSKMKFVLAAIVWLFVVGLFVVGYKYFWAPAKDKQRQREVEQEHKEVLNRTSSPSLYENTVYFAGDGFSGYAPIRSQKFKDECAKFSIRVDYRDDGANYSQRLKELSSGRLDMAVFTIDALIKTSTELGDMPVAIVALIDESKGADGIVALGKDFPNIDSMNNPKTKFVCVENSPSETLCRVVMAHFNLDKMSKEPFEFLDSEESVYKRYQRSKSGDNCVFAMWEPYLGKVTDNPDYHVLVDSGKFRGYIMDAIVVRRGFLVKNEAVVTNVVKSYLSTIFTHRNAMTDLLIEDSKISGDILRRPQAEKLVKSIWWKNTQESFSHFGLTRGKGMQPLEDVCRNITDVLLRTGAIKKDLSNGKPNLWYYDGVMKKLHDSSWHPGFGDEDVRGERSLKELSEDEWKKIKPVGTFKVDKLVFARGTALLTKASESTLADLSEKLKAWPNYYLTISGHAAGDNNDSALKLAEERAKSASTWLTSNGVNPARIRTTSAVINGSTSVIFVVGEFPY